MNKISQPTLMTINTNFISQSPTPSLSPSPGQVQNSFDPGIATIWAALITAGLSLVATIISLLSNRRLMTRLEKERQEHAMKLANMQQNHEAKLENARLRPERRLQFIGYWRNLLRNDTLTYRDILKDKAYKTLESFISFEAVNLIQQELKRTEAEKKLLDDHLDLEWTALNYPNLILDDEEYAQGVHLPYEIHYVNFYQHLHPSELEEIERKLEKERKGLEQFDLNLTEFIKDKLEEELRRLEREEWELL